MRVFYPKMKFGKMSFQILKTIFIKIFILHTIPINKYCLGKVFKEIYFHQITKYPFGNNL